MKRFIRLKEFSVNIEEYIFPSENYSSKKIGLSHQHGYLKLTDENGCLSTAIPFEEGDEKIFLIGDSSLENIYCDFNSTIHQLLHRKLLDYGVNCQVINMGVSGSTSLIAFNAILNKLIDEVGSIVFFIPSNDLKVLDLKNGYRNNEKYFSNIVSEASGESTEGFFEENKKQLFSIIDLLNSFCKNSNKKLYIFGVISSPGVIIYNEINLLVKYFCEKLGIKYHLVENYPDNSFVDAVHLNEKGANHVANSIYKIVINALQANECSLIHQEYLKEDVDVKLLVKGVRLLLITIDVETIGDCEKNSLLVWFDFLENNNISEAYLKRLGVYESNSVGYYRYLEIPEFGKRVVMLHKFILPEGTEYIKLGLKKFRSKSCFKIHNAEIFFRKTDAFLE